MLDGCMKKLGRSSHVPVVPVLLSDLLFILKQEMQFYFESRNRIPKASNKSLLKSEVLKMQIHKHTDAMQATQASQGHIHFIVCCCHNAHVFCRQHHARWHAPEGAAAAANQLHTSMGSVEAKAFN